ncbi:uncharacterized protein LOC123714706 isoform X1 [Pieris brassicae]|uniref:uncharacterized protein LOC123714706 isoform X1 n=1 Tax=Pieris brassicae TaxID=7116 RepID=UPI001E6610CA|nr:uncharacterized protein LOC123714706 isoform X1 [Pieris brassicae]
MHFEKQKIIFKMLLIMMIISAFAEAFEDHKINLKIGFDLIPKADGSPSVRIRDFEDFNLRKFGRRADKSIISIRADGSSSETEENKEVEKEDKDSEVDVAQSSESDDRALRSTKGINPDEFEPEPNPRLHNRGKSSDTDSAEAR